MVFFKALEMQKKSEFPKKIDIFQFLNWENSVDKFLNFIKLYIFWKYLEHSFNHISWALTNYDINFINLKNRTISKILEIHQIQEASFQCVTKKIYFEFHLLLNVHILTLENNPLDNGLLLSQTDCAKTEM